MGLKERELIDHCLASLRPTQRRFRLNAGQAWAGEVVRRTESTITLKNPRVFHGAPTGFPDLVGWDEITITEDMVGQKVACFVGEEFKTGKLKLSKFQKLFRDCLEKMGGIFREIRGD